MTDTRTMSQTPRLAVVPGTFDPMTNGHLDLVARGLRLFDQVVVAVLINREKTPFFPLDERVAMIREALAETNLNAEVDTFDGLLADYVAERDAVAVLRGLRSESELATEMPVALMNRHLHAGCETVFLVPGPDTIQVSSRLVREIAAFGGRIDDLVPRAVAARLAARQS
jgi:pantetheine-phosphate adenylyltransferase